MPEKKKIPTRKSRSKTGMQKTAKRCRQPCKDCGHVPESDALFCPMCGVSLEEPGEKASQTPAPVCEREPAGPPEKPEPVAEVAAAKPKPVAETPDETAADEDPAETPRSCQCGQELPADAQFCMQCGAKIGQAPSRYRLLCTSSDGDIAVDIADDEIVIGKAGESGLAIPSDEYVSRQHARVFISDGKIILEDLGSSNGTYLRVHQPVSVEPGDEILVGASVLRIEEARP